MNRTGDYTGTGYQANLAGRSGSGVVYNVGGRSFGADSAEGKRFMQKRMADSTAAANSFVAKQNASEAAQVDQQEVEDRIAENKSRNAGMNALAFSQAQGGGRMGRGLFQRRQAGTKIGQALGTLATQNAGTMKAARMKTLQAKQAADPLRSNPLLGYRFAMQSLQRELA